MISSNDLTYFLEVAHTGNLSRAAERIGISQPSLSLSIKRIEQELGLDILIRTKRGVYLTKSGKHLLKHARQMQEYWQQIKNEAISSTEEIKGSISIGCHPSVGLYTLDHFVPQIMKNNKDLEFTFHHDLSRKITEGVISMKIDIGLVINPVRHPDLIIHNLINDTVSLWQSKKKSTFTDTKGEEAVLICDPELIQTQDILKSLKKKGHKFKRVISSGSLENIANLVAKGVGVGVLPSRVANKLASNKITPIPGAPEYKDTLAAVYRVENRGVKSIQHIIGEVNRSIK